MTAERLTDESWIVGSPDPASPAFTSEYDCVQYLIWADGAGYLIDAGSGLGADAMLANVSEVISGGAVSGALISHYHADHAGGAAAVAAAGIPLFASPETAAALATADEEVTALRVARRAGVYPEDFRLAPADVHALDEVAELPLPWGRLVSLTSPGHCAGHLTFLLERDGVRGLFSGDVIFAGGEVSIQAIPDCRLDEYADTVIGLDELGIDRLFPGHGKSVLTEASQRIAPAAESFRRLVPPPNLLRPFGFDA